MSPRLCVVDADKLSRDSAFPNLAIMKIASYAKKSGYDVTLVYDDTDIEYTDFDVVTVSKVFDFSKETPKLSKFLDESCPDSGREGLHLDVKYVLDSGKGVAIGGTGYFGVQAINLDPEIEHIMPDYHIYDGYVQAQLDAGVAPSRLKEYTSCSIGFTTRGCHRKCSFCVNRKYSKSELHSPISEFYDPERPYICLLDDNVLAYEGAKDILDELISLGRRFKYKQGLDIRLLDDEIGQRLRKAKYWDDVTFAFDNYNQRDIIDEKLTLWSKYSATKMTKLYILCGYENYAHNIVRTQEEQDARDIRDIRETFDRIRIVAKHNCKPYIMRHDYHKASRFKDIYTQIAHWANQPMFLYRYSMEGFCQENQARTKTSIVCAPMRALNLLKSEAPDVYSEFCTTRYYKDAPTKRKRKHKGDSSPVMSN